MVYAAGQGNRAGSSVVEHLTFNQVVAGSIPARLTNKIMPLIGGAGLLSSALCHESAHQRYQ